MTKTPFQILLENVRKPIDKGWTHLGFDEHGVIKLYDSPQPEAMEITEATHGIIDTCLEGGWEINFGSKGQELDFGVSYEIVDREGEKRVIEGEPDEGVGFFSSEVVLFKLAESGDNKVSEFCHSELNDISKNDKNVLLAEFMWPEKQVYVDTGLAFNIIVADKGLSNGAARHNGFSFCPESKDLKKVIEHFKPSLSFNPVSELWTASPYNVADYAENMVVVNQDMVTAVIDCCVKIALIEGRK